MVILKNNVKIKKSEEQKCRFFSLSFSFHLFQSFPRHSFFAFQFSFSPTLFQIFLPREFSLNFFKGLISHFHPLAKPFLKSNSNCLSRITLKFVPIQFPPPSAPVLCPYYLSLPLEFSEVQKDQHFFFPIPLSLTYFMYLQYDNF